MKGTGPIPFLKFSTTTTTIDDTTSTIHTATGLTKEAKKVLSGLQAPIYIIAFTGQSRSGKSFTASHLYSLITSTPLAPTTGFKSKQGNSPCTFGIDMLVFPHPTSGSMVFLDCEGGGNHNSTGIPYVIGLAARISGRLYVFERGCFTSTGLESVMQIVNMGNSTTVEKNVRGGVTDSLVLVENMSVNWNLSEFELLTTLFETFQGDETTNRIRGLIRKNFNVEFCKVPYFVGDSGGFESACVAVAKSMLVHTPMFMVSGVPASGKCLVKLVDTLLAQIRSGGSKFNMVSATEALVSNMSIEAATAAWLLFIKNMKSLGNHPSQITGRKSLRKILEEVEGEAKERVDELEGFMNSLEPKSAAMVGKVLWERNLKGFVTEVKAVYYKKEEEVRNAEMWFESFNEFVQSLVRNFADILRYIYKVVKFSSSLLLTGNWYMVKQGIMLVSGTVRGYASGLLTFK